MILDEIYMKSTAVSQSKLKRLLIHPQYYLNYSGDSEFDEPKQTLTIGDGVDILLTQGRKVFKENFLVTDIEKPTGQMGDFVWYLFAHRNESNAEQLAYEKAGFKRDTLQKVRDRFPEEGKPYYDILVEGETKRVITRVQYDKILAIIDSFKTNDFTREYFVDDSGRYTVFNQVPVDFTYEGVECKGLLDKVFVDRLTDELIPVDIKTTSFSTNSWDSSAFYKLRYDIQAAFYIKALNSIDIKERFGATSILPFKFIVENQDFPGNPLIYEISPETLHIGEFGGEVRGRKLEGFKHAIERYKWHTENDLWLYPMGDYLNKGVRKI